MDPFNPLLKLYEYYTQAQPHNETYIQSQIQQTDPLFNSFFFITNGVFVLSFLSMTYMGEEKKRAIWNFILSIPIPLSLSFLLQNIFQSPVNEDTENDAEDDNKISQDRKHEEANKYTTHYEDKYLEKFRNTPDDLVWTPEEEIMEKEKIEELTIEYKNSQSHWKEKIQACEELLNTRKEQAMIHYEDMELNLLVKETEQTLNEYKQKRDAEIPDEQTLQETIQAEALQYMIDQRLTNLKNNILMEKTPLGNVLMYYDKKKETFSHYSDATIPYRFLEVIARRYVLTFQCKNLYVDMEVELKEAERKWQDHKKWEEEQKAKAPTKKDVFAKFKSYNKDNGKSVTQPNRRAPQTNKSAPFSQYKIQTKSKEEDMILLKERANRYTYEGKFLDYPFIKKPEKKLTDKRQGMTFADFKRMQRTILEIL